MVVELAVAMAAYAFRRGKMGVMNLSSLWDTTCSEEEMILRGYCKVKRD